MAPLKCKHDKAGRCSVDFHYKLQFYLHNRSTWLLPGDVKVSWENTSNSSKPNIIGGHTRMCQVLLHIYFCFCLSLNGSKIKFRLPVCPELFVAALLCVSFHLVLLKIETLLLKWVKRGFFPLSMALAYLHNYKEGSLKRINQIIPPCKLMIFQLVWQVACENHANVAADIPSGCSTICMEAKSCLHHFPFLCYCSFHLDKID